MIGKTLGHYEILSAIGKGGMGEVYRARDTTLGRDVAIKMLPEEFARDTDRLARFEREARLLASLNHPHIAAIYGLEESDGTRFLVLELVEGETLAGRLERGPIPVDESLRIALQIAEALEAAHEKGVVHRDLKPANIKVTPEDRVKVLDFGLAKAFVGENADAALSNSPTLSMAATRQDVILGTAAYMSPEQAKGRTVDARTDIWALGCVLYELLTARQAFSGDDVSTILARVLEREPDYDALPGNLHPRIHELIRRCLEKDPQGRWQAAGDIRIDIRQLLSDPAGLRAAPLPAMAARRSAPALVGIGIALLAGIALGWLARPAPEASTSGVTRFSWILPEDQAFNETSPLSMAAVSPDGRQVAYAANGQLYLKNLGETEARPIPGTNEDLGGASAPAFSPDGQWLAYVHLLSRARGVIKRVPVNGGTPVTVVTANAEPTDLTWPTEDTMVFANGNGIFRVPAGGGATEVLVPAAPGERLSNPQLLPGGEEILFARIPLEAGELWTVERWNTAEILVETIGREDRTVVWEGGSAPMYVTTGHLLYAQGDTLFALAYDKDARRVRGGPVPMMDGMRRSPGGETAHYAVSSTGALVWIPGIGGTEFRGVLALMDPDGAASPLDVEPAQYRSPRFSPDGQRLAVEIIDDNGLSDIWIYDLSGASGMYRLTQGGNNTRPAWTPDGERVTFGSDRDGRWGIYWQPTDGSGAAERLISAEDGGLMYPESWSPNGETLSFVEISDGWDLWTFAPGDGSSRPIAAGDGNQFGSVFSPAGDWIAYADSAEPFGIRAQPFPPSPGGVIRQVTGDGEAWPVWSETGELFYRLRLDIASEIQIRGIEVETDSGFAFRNPRTLPLPEAVMYPLYRDYDLAPRGDRFVIIVPTEERNAAADFPNRIDVVLNWQEELLERVPVD